MQSTEGRLGLGLGLGLGLVTLGGLSLVRTLWYQPEVAVLLSSGSHKIGPSDPLNFFLDCPLYIL